MPASTNNAKNTAMPPFPIPSSSNHRNPKSSAPPTSLAHVQSPPPPPKSTLPHTAAQSPAPQSAIPLATSPPAPPLPEIPPSSTIANTASYRDSFLRRRFANSLFRAEMQAQPKPAIEVL